MKLVYTTKAAEIKKGYAHRNPIYFERAEPDAEHVTIVGNWPDVIAAYEKAGIEVSRDTAVATQAEDKGKSKGLTVAEIKEELAVKGIEIPEGVTKKADLQALLDAVDGPDLGEGEQ
ncbi:hypothetical protein L1889_18290 [Paenalcaligenes niemegkensis]|uniref:hypothetical protein n=1 Tax=Paenalcaligenes niemegkensis TaxID=2895469 RepID=UPI001EE96F4C|nr:hypothetical protein [Paenalcaligenes niemegkensis]MCQ9618390.1 hypothetical protein [Paenalcaligenes niemegkensis]